MPKQRDIDRFLQGIDVWNAWAEQCLLDKKALQNAGNWSVDENGEAANGMTAKWMNEASVDFRRHHFASNANFHGYVFPHTANFDSIRFNPGCRIDLSLATFHGNASFVTVKFRGRVDFRNATFHGDAIFRDSTFESIARFNPARFHQTAGFRRVTFSDNAWFGGARFDDSAVFSEATFGSTANFSNSVFAGLASFNWAESTGPFSLSNAIFELVPDFTQMSFRAPVRLDHLDVVQARAFQRTGDKERSARYRALKKIAIEAHDHVREQNFFASEAREQRGDDDPEWSPAWVFSFIYEFLSDFGRSIAAPFFWWTVSTFAFWLIYLSQRDFAANKVCKIDPAWESLYLSLKSAFLVIGWERSHKLNQVYSCLYGGSIERPELPVAIPFLQMGQTLWSAILIFLFLLALRNHFRIK